MMGVVKTAFVAIVISSSAASVLAQESGIAVRAVRVLASDPEAVALFYEKAFGMSETRRPANTPTFKEIVINSGSTPELAKKATSTPIVIATRPKDAPAGAMASLILDVPNLERAVETVKAAGGTLMRPVAKSSTGLSYAFVKDIDGNQIELVLKP